jgi:hypothetical protein
VRLAVAIIKESPLQTTYKILSIILLSKLKPIVHEIIGNHQCGSIRNQIICKAFDMVRERYFK